MEETRYIDNDEKENAIFAVKLRELFKNKGASQQDLADYIEKVTGESVTRQAIGQWCNGHTCPNLKTVPVIAEFFNVSTDYLLTDTNIKNTDPDLRAICEYTKLSEEAAELLHNNTPFSSTISRIISSDAFWGMAQAMRKLSITSQRAMDWSMIYDNKAALTLADTLDITHEQAKDLIRSYVYDKYKMMCAELPKDCNYIYIPKEVLSDNTNCEIYRYELIKNSEKISNLFDHREDYLKFTREELTKYLGITKDKMKALREETAGTYVFEDDIDDENVEEIADETDEADEMEV